MLRKTLTQRQWVALVILFVGISIVQLQPETSKQHTHDTTNKQRPLLGLFAVIVSCLMSGFAGVYFEKILKGTKQSIWLRNVQLGVLGTVIGFITMELKEGEKVRDMGFFYGYDLLVWVVICLQSLGGLLVAVVVKYADNILKGFATSAAIIVSCCASMIFFSFQLSLQFIVGAGLVMTSVYMYGRYSAPPNLKPAPMVTEKVRHVWFKLWIVPEFFKISRGIPKRKKCCATSEDSNRPAYLSSLISLHFVL